jgi:hypothetical protein
MISGELNKLGSKGKLRMVVSAVFAPICFYIGILSIVIFAFKNPF